jgi:MFS family permease
LSPATPVSRGSTTSAITLLALASFASQSMVRVSDSLLPQIATDFGVSVGSASIVVTAYALAHGSVQLIIGPVGDRFGKYACVTAAAAMSTVLVLMCGLAGSLSTLVAARLACGLSAGWIIPLALAFLGDVIPYERRQQVLGTFLSGQILGQLFGQAAGGVLGDLFGWRNVFFFLATLFAVATIALLIEFFRNPITHAGHATATRSRGFVKDYATVLRSPWARAVIVIGFVEALFMFGAFAFVGADLHLRFGISFAMVGIFVGAFAGEPARPDRTRYQRLCAARPLLPDNRVHAASLRRALRHHGDRAWLLHAAQHAADQRHANDAASARHRRGDFFVRALPRADAGRCHQRHRVRPFRFAASIRDRGRGLARIGIMVRARAEAAAGRGCLKPASHLSRPSTSSLLRGHKDVDARDKRGHERDLSSSSDLSFVITGLVPVIPLRKARLCPGIGMPGTRPGMTKEHSIN